MGRRGLVGTVVAIALAAAALLAPAAPAFGPVGSFGGYGEGAGQLLAPGGIAVGPGGNFFVADNGNDRVGVFAPGGEFLYAFGKGVRPGGGDVCDALSGCQSGDGGDAAGALERPEGIAVSAAGDVFVTEEGNDRVSVFTVAGVFGFAFGSGVDPAGGNVCTAASGCRAGSNDQPPGSEEEFPGPEAALSEPRGVAVAADGNVFVADTGNNRISVFDSTGQFAYMFGIEVEGKPSFESFCETQCIEGFGYDGAGGMNEPSAVATLPGDRLVVSDAANHRLDVFTEEGEFVRAFAHDVRPQPQPPQAPLHPWELDVCTAGTGCHAGSGEGAGSLGAPAGLAVSPSGAIAVGDVELERVSQFDPSGEFVRAFGAGVASGAAAFEICIALTDCRAGDGETDLAGATPLPFGVAEACGGSLFVAESTSGLSRVERFGEPGGAQLFCPAPKVPDQSGDPGLPKDQGQPKPPPAPPGDAAPPAPAAVPSAPANAIAIGAARRDRRRGTARLAVTVPGPGRLALAGRGIRSVARTLAAAATVALPVRLLGKPRRALLAHGRRRVTAKITFLPSGGSPRTERRKLTLVKRLPRPRTRGG